MKQMLTKFGFKGLILSAILVLYSTPSSQVYMNSLLSKPFSISNGTWQGWPLSPTIFNLMIEPLVESIRSHPLITGYKFQDRSHIIDLFVGDVILMFTNPLVSLPHAHGLLSEFGLLSYYKVNFIKSLIPNLGVPTTTVLTLRTQ